MRKVTVLVSVVILLALVSLLSSFSFYKTDNTVTPTVPAPTPTPAIENDTEISLLKLEIKLLKSHNQQMLGTIYWSIGAVFTIALFIVGAGWYVNFRLYDKDKIEITQSLEASLKKRFEQEKKALQINAQKYSETAASELQSKFKSGHANYAI